MAPSWSGWAGAFATLVVGVVPPVVGMFNREPSAQATQSHSIVYNYFLYWQDGARQITGIGSAPSASVNPDQKSVAQLAAQTDLPPQTGSYYIDSLIKVIPVGASFDKYMFAQAGAIIENISGKELPLAVEYRGVRAISNLGGSSECGLDGLKSINGLSQELDPLAFSRLAPGAKVAISITNCQQITSKDKVKSLSVNLPLITIDNERTKQFSASLNSVAIRQ